MLRVGLHIDYKIEKIRKSTVILKELYNKFLEQKVSPTLIFSMHERSNSKISSVSRVLKRFPDMNQFNYLAEPWEDSGEAAVNQIGNSINSPHYRKHVDFDTLSQIVAGIPKIYPFSAATLRLTHPTFGADPNSDIPSNLLPGVIIGDRWGLSRRDISLTALVVLDADPRSETLPEFPRPIAAVLRTCGRPTLIQQIVMPGQRTEIADKVAEAVRDFRARFSEVIERARMPYNFSIADDHHCPHESVDPRKPDLVKIFGPLGYKCRGDGMMILVCRRRTSTNLIIELYWDFGTWSKLVSVGYTVRGLGFSTTIRLPMALTTPPRVQCLLINQARWLQILANTAALVAEIDRSFIPLIEDAAGPSPAWYHYGTSDERPAS